MTDPTIDNINDVWKRLDDEGQNTLNGIAELFGLMGTWERRCVLYLCNRLLDGQWEYGRFNPETDPRDMDRESDQESADGAIYDTFGAMREVYKRWWGKADE